MDYTTTTEGTGPVNPHWDGFILPPIDRERYERELAEIKRKHLEAVGQARVSDWQPCLHDGCPECHGTGVRLDGSSCVHMISCPCPKCTPRC